METPAYTPPTSLKPNSLAGLGASLRSGWLAFAFQADGQDFSVRIRRLTSSEMDEASGHARSVTPPLRAEYATGAKDGDGKPLWDFDNPSAELKARIEERAKAMGSPSNYDGSGAIVPLPFPLAVRYEKYDHADKEYLAQLDLSQQRQAATILHYGCEGGLTGDTADAKVKAMRELLPNTVIRLLTDRIISISSTGVIEKASFFTPAG
jgi:hypothetical protein